MKKITYKKFFINELSLQQKVNDLDVSSSMKKNYKIYFSDYDGAKKINSLDDISEGDEIVYPDNMNGTIDKIAGNKIHISTFNKFGYTIPDVVNKSEFLKTIRKR